MDGWNEPTNQHLITISSTQMFQIIAKLEMKTSTFGAKFVVAFGHNPPQGYKKNKDFISIIG